MIDSQQSYGVLQLVINRPEKKNALTRDMYQQLSRALNRANGDETVNAIVISGAGGVFTAGNDLDDFRARATDEHPKPSAGLAFIKALMDCDTPVIAAVEGLAIGIGTTLLLHVDVVVAAESAKFKTAFVDLGLVPEAASTVTMPLHLGARKATDLLLLGDVISGSDARDCGLASRLVGNGQALSEALVIAGNLASKPREALRASKRLIRAPWREQVERALERERKVFTERLRSEDCRAALDKLARR
ncbi:MAG: enoyl-CoA hydratase/isomerase family protein [Marinobacter sp.]|uniref:enoyl-CoA hydratase/isomerase family protein n=1 Tax=Marinobacter sp. TaxID=50741 RepID=UPI001B4F8D71|nr:enoyl-CoA hydratase-related protein [Marinobacter sp.]MBQ0747850.1 enoyl-CoA hydratase/isomerase family protein [Marinobacter sp.]MBQ0814725.1 enoyl-CoA hydratase/isomerase family protein [Marinobacter sp.]|tara:strand:+ start:201 stop:941 length:741 start_codon:yes stop_codon:yes gene_type:complete